MEGGDVAETAPGSNTRVMGILCHLLALTGLVIPPGHLIAPGLLWWLKRKSIPVVETEGRKSINFQIACTIVFAVLLMLLVGAWIVGAIIPILGALMTWVLKLVFFAAVLADVVFVVMATLKVSNGERSKYPLSYDFLKKIEDAVSAGDRERDG